MRWSAMPRLQLRPPAQNTGEGGNATAGTATFSNLSGTITFNDLSVTATGTGGASGQGGTITTMIDPLTGNLVSTFTPSFQGQNGGNGGNGTGGNAIVNLGQDDPNPIRYTVDASGVGAAGSDGLTGGSGGDGVGGNAAINVIDSDVNLVDPTIVANASGGAGGVGAADPVTNNAGNSGTGGNATGGTASLQVTGPNGNVDLNSITLASNAAGGVGGRGVIGNGAGAPGDGGLGGNAIGGTSEIVTRTGGTIDVTSGLFTLTSTGSGGTGGEGGQSIFYGQGAGGDGGYGTGGTVRFLAQGGNISGQDVNFTASGTGGDGGLGGRYPGEYGPDGTGGEGAGGTVSIEVQEGSPGIISLADVTAEANGTGGGGPIPGTGAGGRIEITDTSTDPAGLITLNSLTANAFDTNVGTGIGSLSAPLGGFFVTGNSGPIDIAGDLTVNVAGNIQYDFDGNAQMTVAGNADLDAGQNIFISHINNTGSVNSIDVSGTFDANAVLDFDSMDGSRIVSGDTISIRALDNAMVADALAVNRIDLSAGENAMLGDAAVTGDPVTIDTGGGSVPNLETIYPEIRIDAGFNGTPAPTPHYSPQFNATITGDVASTGHAERSCWRQYYCRRKCGCKYR